MAERAAAFKALCAFYVLVIVSKTICALTEWKEGLQYNRNYVNSAANYLTQKGDMNRHVKLSPQQVGEVSRTSRAVRGKEIRRKIYEEYKDFYTTIGLQVVDDSVARREYMDAVRRESDSGVSNLNTLEKQQEEKLPGDVLVMKRLCSALRFGRLPDNEVPQHTLPKFVSYISEMKGHKGSILEIGSGYTVSLLADTTHTYTAIALLIQDSKLPVKENLTYHSIPNLYVGSLFQDNLPAAVEYLYNDNQVLFNTILLSNLTSMVGDLLPHEYEELLARLLSLARNTYVADISTNNKHMLNFFKNWENLPVLLNKCCTVAGLDCVVEQVKGYFGGWNNGREDLYKVQVLTGTRNLPESFCEKSLLEGECYLHFGNESEPVAIHYNDGSQLLVPETSDCIPLQVINYIGPIQSTKERLLYQLLHVPYRDDQRSCTLYINGSNIVSLQDTPVKTGIDSHMWSCEENPQMHALVKKLVDLDPSLTGTEPHEKGLHSAKAGQISPHNFNQKQPQEDRGARVQQPYEQVDSVAERWNRLNNDVKEAAEKDQEQVQRLNKQWDREGNPPLPQQDPVLVRLDKTWRREEDKVGLDPPAVQGQVQGKVQSQGKESLSRNIDPALTKDEKELRLAMGSLGGVKGMEGNPVIAQPKKPIETEGQLPELEKNIIHQKVSSPKYVQNLRSIQHGGTTTTLKSVIREFDPLNKEPVPLAEQHQIPKPVPKRIHGNARKIYRNKYQGVEQQDSRQADYLKNDLVQNGADHLGPVGKIEQQPVVFKPREQGGQIEDRKDGMRRLLQNDAQQGLSLSVREKLDKYKEDFKKTLMNRYKAQRTKIDNDHDQIESKKVTSTQGPVKKMASKTATPSSLSSKEPLVSLNGIRKDSTDQQAAAAQKSELGNNEEEEEEVVAEEMEEEEEALNDEYDFKSPVTSVKPELREPARTVREKHQPMEHTFGPKHKEESVYDSEWKLIKNDIAALNGKERNFFSVLTYGGNQQVLLGAKIAHRYLNSTVLSVLDTSSARHMQGLRKMITSLGAKNFLLLVNNLSPGTVDKIVKMPEIFQIQILGLETFHHLTSLGQGFLYYLGHLLTMAHTTYLEVPSPEQLVMADLLLGNSTGAEQTHAVFKGMIFETLKLHGLENEAEVSLVDDVDILRGYTLATKLVKITLGHMQRTVVLDCQDTRANIQLTPDKQCRVGVSKQETRLARCMEGIGLELLLGLGLDKVARKNLLREYLSLPVYPDMCPHHLVWYNNTLVYHAADSTRRFLQSSTELSRLIASQAAVSVLGNEIYTQPFSFMEYKSMEGEMIKLLAKHYKNSTFISLHSELEEAEKLYQETWKMNVTNIVITSLAVDQDFTTKLLQSPDFLRYQYFGVQAFLDSVMTMGDDEFNLMVGQMIANGVTSFFQLPSAEMLSLAFATFFPESFTGRPLRGNGTLDRKDIYYLKHHPAPVFENAELKMLGESAEADVNISISAELLQPPFMQSASFPWKVVRVDVRNLTVTVNHHFDYQLDGHDRKYTLHCLAHSKSTYEVYLIRKGDGFKIPYGDVHAISLIALLRMGLLEPIKTMFYDLFLTLPFYEDMAPWNIVFRSGRLEYIDYDTKDFTFNKMVPAAYQVMAMLMNYERTINDFGHCKQHGINQYNFPYVSHCVGSDYEGPCKDSRYPVPCGDYTCKSTYIECLKSLSELEKKKMEWKQRMVANLKTPGFVYTGRQNLPYTSGQWSFGQFGAKNPQNGVYLRQRPPQQKSYSGPQFAQDNQRRRFW